MSPASFSFPSERTPSPLEDYESPKVHLETGEKFTRQGTFADNIVVPTDRCDDPSFFSGLSKSNTPDRIQIAPIDEEESEEETEKEGEDIYFEPVIELPRQVEFRSGEEDETVIFEERAKLFRFQDGEWKERGLGALKLLWNNTTGHARILMRREKVLKICANHFLTRDMVLKAGKGSDRSWVWNTLADISDDKTKPQQFAAKFQTKEIAEKFKTKFEELQQKKALFVPESPAVSPFAANPLATKLTPDHTKVPVLSSNLPYLSSTPNKPVETLLTKPSNVGNNQSKNVSQGTPCSNNTRASSKNNGVIDVDNFWNQPQTGINNIPYFQLNKPSDNGKEPERSQYSYLPSTTSHPQNTFSFSFGSESHARSNEVPENKNASDSKNKDIFGNTIGKGSLSFQDLASNSGTGIAFTPLGANGTGFSGFGKPIFSVPDNDKEDEHDTENEANVDFRPIVSLPPVKNQVTGEEGELTKFSERAKLFRFDPANKEWKERGLGEIKLLYDPSSGKSRVVMRREQVHKLCANHFILPDMKLKATTTSNRSWLWHTHADVSDGEPKAEQLVVKFKQEETASEFKKVFEELQSICPTSKSCDPDADQDTSTNMSVAPSSESTAPRSQMNNDLKVLFQPPAGSWSCDKCMVQNSSQSTQCVACQSPKAGLSQLSQKPLFSFAPSPGFSFGSPALAVPASSQPNDNTKSDSGFTFASPSFSFGSQTPKDKATDSDTSKPNVNTGFSFDSGKTLPNKFVFGEKKADKPPFVFSLSDSNSDSGQKSAMFNASPFQSTPTSDTKNKENYKDDPMSQEKEKPLKDTSIQPSLTLAFQPAKGSWECGTCLVRNNADSNVCVACQSPKHRTQPAVTNPGFNFGTSHTNKASSAGTGFSFGPTDTSEDSDKNSGFSFGRSVDNKAPGTSFTFGSHDTGTDQSQVPAFSSVSSDESKDVIGKSSPDFGASDSTEAAVNTTNLKLAFQLAEGSWECDTCLVRNNADSNVCAACQTPKPGTQPVVTQTTSSNSKPSGFTFVLKDSATLKETGFSFGYPEASKETGPNFSFIPDNASQPQAQTTDFSFGSNEKDRMSKVPTTGFNFDAVDANKEQSGNASFSFGPTDAHSSKGSSFNFVPSSTGSSKETAFSFGAGNASEDVDKAKQELEKDATSFADSEDVKPSSFKDGDTDSEETTVSESEASDEEECFLKLPTPGSSDLSEKDLGLIVKHPTGSWECETCLIQNAAAEISCAACQTPKSCVDISAQKTAHDSVAGKDAETTGFGNQDSYTATGNDDLKLKFQAPEGAWICDACLVRNDKQNSSCVACQTPKLGAEQTNKALNSATFAFSQSTPKQGSFGLTPSATTQSNVPPSNTFTFGKPLSEGFTFGNSLKGSQQSGFNCGVAGSSTGEEGSTPVFTLGLDDSSKGFRSGPAASGQSGFKFGDVPTNQSTFTFGSDQPYEFGKPVNGTTGDSLFLDNKKPVDSDFVTSEDKDFSKHVPKLQDSTNILSQGTFTFSLDVPKQLTMTSPGNKDISEENPETEDERVVFKPIVSLPSEVDAKTGEDEKTLFSSHAKLCSFTQNSWKERGVGELKVLYAPTRQRGRVIMRRDQVRALCANHFITKDMELKPQGSSGKSWLWYVRGDFAENEPNEQLFSIKFGDKEAAIAFKCAFEECTDHKVSVLSEDVEDEVIVLYDVSVTEEQRARATKFLLPPNFYAYENKAAEAKQDDDKT